MNNDRLKKSIGILYDMELNNYLMTRGIQDLQRKIDGLGHPRMIPEPKMKKGDSDTGDYASMCIIFSIIGGIIGIISCSSSIDGIFGVLDVLFSLPFYALVGAFVGCVVGFFVAGVFDVSNMKELNAQYEHEYNVQLQKYRSACEEDKKRIEIELREREYLKNQQQKMRQRLIEAVKETSNFYIIVGIDNKYRNIVPISYMSEFLRLGISSKLEGVDGLYYLVRKELRMDQMQHSLLEISQKLDTIIDNQREIYGELISINCKCDMLVSNTVQLANQYAEGNIRLDEVVQSSELSAYYAKRMSQMQEYEHYLKY